MSQKVLIEDLLEYKFLENLQYNPSGTVIAYQAAKVMKRNKHIIEISGSLKMVFLNSLHQQ